MIIEPGQKIEYDGEISHKVVTIDGEQRIRFFFRNYKTGKERDVTGEKFEPVYTREFLDWLDTPIDIEKYYEERAAKK